MENRRFSGRYMLSSRYSGRDMEWQVHVEYRYRYNVRYSGRYMENSMYSNRCIKVE